MFQSRAAWKRVELDERVTLFLSGNASYRAAATGSHHLYNSLKLAERCLSNTSCRRRRSSPHDNSSARHVLYFNLSLSAPSLQSLQTELSDPECLMISSFTVKSLKTSAKIILLRLFVSLCPAVSPSLKTRAVGV